LLCWAGALTANAQHGARVVQTLGDSGEATCVEVHGRTLWLGTLGAGMFRVRQGLHERFDATTGLPGNRVRDCALYGDVPWVATEAGLARLDTAAQRFVVVRRGRYLRLAAAGEVLVAARADGLVERFVGGVRAGERAIAAVPSALVLASDGRWALGSMNGAIHVGHGTGTVRRVVVPERAQNAAEPIDALAIDADALVAATASGVLRVVDWKEPSGALRALLVPAGEASATSSAVAPALPAGVLVHDRARFDRGWVFATDAGVFVQHAAGEAAVALALDGQPCGDRISALAVQGGLLWVGSFDRGLCRYDGRSWTQYRGRRHLPSDMVNALAVSGGSLHVATAQGLTLVDADGRFTQFTHEQCAGKLDARCPWHAAVNGVATDGGGGQVWVADVGAVHRIDLRSGAWHHVSARAGVASSSLTRVAAFNGEVAIGTSDQGVYLMRDGKARAIGDQDGVADNWITDLAYDARGRLWMATCTRGVSVRDEHGSIRTLTTRDGLADDYALSVQELGGKIWIGTLSGLNIVDGDAITTLSVYDGLSGNEVHDAVEYGGAVWVATDGGLSVIEPAADGAPKAAAAPVYSGGAR
jgi:ligand-binding sensor domain-containing protein